MPAFSLARLDRLTSRRRARLAGWVGLLLLVLDIFLGTAVPVARAAQSDRLVSIAAMAVCTMDGVLMLGDGAADESSGRDAPSVFCSACLPLVQLLAPPAVLSFAPPSRLHAFVAAAAQLTRPAEPERLGFSARAPPAFV